MTDKPSDKEIGERFQRTLEKLVGTPPKPHRTQKLPEDSTAKIGRKRGE